MLKHGFDPGWDEEGNRAEGQFSFLVLMLFNSNDTDKCVSEKFQNGKAE